MSQKQKLRVATEEIKRWAIDNMAPSTLHSLIQKLNDEVEAMEEGEEDGEGDPGGNNPLKKPPIP